jgi:hypothetical protein
LTVSGANYSSTLRGRRLARTLVQLRDAAGMTAEQAADELRKEGGRWSKSKISRIEDPRFAAPTPRDVRDMLDLYGVKDAPQRDALIQLATQARQRGWWTAYDDVLRGSHIVGLEAEATVMHSFEPMCVPGLLQTEAYARAVTRAALVTEPERAVGEIDRRVEARMKRQELLDRAQPPQFWAVIEEAALLRPVGGAVTMREQIDRLTELGERPNITLQVIQTSAGAHPGMSGAFVILEFPDPDDAPVVFLETAAGGMYLEEPEQLRRYTLRFDHLRASALGPDESVRFMNTIRGQLG